MFTKLIAVVSLVAAVAQGTSLSARQNINGSTTHQVLVGFNSTLTFFPDAVAANVNDNIDFVFFANNHSLALGSFADPCDPIQDGFVLPFNQVVSANASIHPVITIKVNTTSPTWIYCPQTIPKNHCHAGMVFAINPTLNKTVLQFQQNALNSGNATATATASNSSSSSVPSNPLAAALTPRSRVTNAAFSPRLTAVAGLLGIVASGMLIL